jgi:hypothetical protein
MICLFYFELSRHICLTIAGNDKKWATAHPHNRDVACRVVGKTKGWDWWLRHKFYTWT